MRRVVLDTNVLVSSLFGGNPRELRDLWQDEQFVWCLSQEIYAEYVKVLGRFKEVREEPKSSCGCCANGITCWSSLLSNASM